MWFCPKQTVCKWSLNTGKLGFGIYDARVLATILQKKAGLQLSWSNGMWPWIRDGVKTVVREALFGKKHKNKQAIHSSAESPSFRGESRIQAQHHM